MEFTYVAGQSAYFHAGHHRVSTVLAFWGLPHIFLSSSTTWVKDIQKYRIKIQRHFCIGQLRNPFNIANIKVSNVLFSLSPLSISLAMTNKRGVQQTVENKAGIHSAGKSETDALSTLVSKALETHTLDPQWFVRVWIDFPDVTFQRLSNETSVSYSLPCYPLPTFWSSYDVSMFLAIQTVGRK